eukprot:7325743-Pyramimonas_sp.AAC.1
MAGGRYESGYITNKQTAQEYYKVSRPSYTPAKVKGNYCYRAWSCFACRLARYMQEEKTIRMASNK